MEIKTKCWPKEIVLVNIGSGDTWYSYEVAVVTPMFNFATPVPALHSQCVVCLSMTLQRC